jgi:hypothetical protein
MRKLTVKNFSVIKDAELEFGKITVLIGPQSSGKSLLCKLAYFLGTEVIGIAVSWIKEGLDFSSFEEAVKRDFEKWFPITGWGNDKWEIYLYSAGYTVNLAPENADAAKLSLTINSEFRDLFVRNLTSKDYIQAAREFRDLSGAGVWDSITYIPSERAYFVDTSKGYRYMASDPDPLVKRFAILFENSRNLEIPKPRMQDHLKGSLLRGEDAWLFAFEDGRILPLSNLSSGSKELLPLFSVLEMYESQRPSSVFDSDNRPGIDTPSWINFDDFYIEEPESHIFPDMQQIVVRYFAELANSERLRPHFTITTHSPYILSSFNNLIEAGQIAKTKPDLKSEIAKIIPEQYWVKEGDFKAYAIENGELKSILNESGFIEGNYLDQVSEVIGNEFDELLRLEYDHTKAI